MTDDFAGLPYDKQNATIGVYEEGNAEARFWHRRYDEQHRTLHHAEDKIAELRADVAALRKAAQAVVDEWNGPPDGRTERDEAIEPLVALLSGLLVLSEEKP